LDTSPGSLNTARRYLAGCGTQTAGLAFGGLTTPTPSPVVAATEEYDGTTWTSNPTGLNTTRAFLAGCRYSNSSFSFWWLSYTRSLYRSNRRI
jgi:hypothetical protein